MANSRNRTTAGARESGGAARTAARQPRQPRKPRRTRTGETTPELVLRVARELLIDEGYARFSVRRVAEAAGITVGNLTYHYASKRELVRALTGTLLSEYDAARERLYAEASARPGMRLDTLIEWMLRDSASRITNRLFRELWAMALHDPVAARALDDFYDAAMNSLAKLLQIEHPALDAASALELVHLLAIVSEGTSVIYGTRTNRRVSLERMTEVFSGVMAAALSARISR